MDNVVVHAKIDYDTKWIFFVFWFGDFALSLTIGRFLEPFLGEYTEVFFMVLAIALYILWELYIGGEGTQDLMAEFQSERVFLHYRKKCREIKYSNIKEIEKTMVLTRYSREKGYYRVKIKTSGRNYIFYSPYKDYEEHLDFEEVELYSLYRAFKEHGIKCC